MKEDEDYKFICQTTFMYKIIDNPYFLIWWILSDLAPVIMDDCEIMAKLVCNSSLVKDHDYRLKKLSFSYKVCTECPLGIRDLLHLDMQCPDTQEIRTEMFALINTIDDVYVKDVIAEQQDLFYVINFKLGNDRVLEKQSYDHVGVKACLYKDDNPRVDEKIVKARRAFNA